jgi:flagellar motor switch protein FliN/FliY
MNLDDLLADVDELGTPPPRVAPPPEAAEPVEMVEAAPVLDTPAPAPAPAPAPSVEMVYDLELELMVELGQARLPLGELLALRPGSRFPLEQQHDDPLLIYLGNRLIARGEALVVDGRLAVRVTRMLTPGAA